MVDDDVVVKLYTPRIEGLGSSFTVAEPIDGFLDTVRGGEVRVIVSRMGAYLRSAIDYVVVARPPRFFGLCSHADDTRDAVVGMLATLWAGIKYRVPTDHFELSCYLVSNGAVNYLHIPNVGCYLLDDYLVLDWVDENSIRLGVVNDPPKIKIDKSKLVYSGYTSVCIPLELVGSYVEIDVKLYQF